MWILEQHALIIAATFVATRVMSEPMRLAMNVRNPFVRACSILSILLICGFIGLSGMIAASIVQRFGG